MSNQKASKAPASAEGTTLSPKDSAAFRNMMDLYNMKQYKKSLKIAETLLAKYPKYGEALSFKALLLTNTDPTKRDEILELAREGLKYDLRSYLCWHVLGVVYKQRHMFKDSVKCFIMALRIDPRNDRLLRDICSLHIEMGDYHTFRKYANMTLQIKTTSYKDWMVFAFANHMCGCPDKALKIAKEAIDIFKNNYGVEPFELSGALLYLALLMEQNGLYTNCMQFLQEKEASILDPVMRLEYLGRSAVFAKDWERANETYKQLAQMNPGNARYPLLYIATHKDVVTRNIFQLPGADVYLAAIGAKSLETINGETKVDPDQKEVGIESPQQGAITGPGATAAILLSEEILDIDGIYSTSNWCMENMLNRAFDRFVNQMRQAAEVKENPTKDEALFMGCYDYPQYVRKVSSVLDLGELPDPASVKLGDVEDVLAAYLADYPVARNCVYRVRSKLTPWSRYPLFIRTRDISKQESSVIIAALEELQQTSYMIRSLRISFSPLNDVNGYHKILEAAIETGCLNVFKYLEHDCTVSSFYCMMVLLERYHSNLSQGFRMGHGIGNGVADSGLSAKDEKGHNIAVRNYALLVRMLMAKVYDYVGEYRKALSTISGDLKAYPTCIELHLYAGKIYRHLGNFRESRNAYCKAYDLDRSDRQTSTKASKAMLRAGDFEKSRKRWRDFLLEDVERDAKGKSDADKGKKTKEQEAPPEIKSMKYELMLADRYMGLYLKGCSENKASDDAGDHLDCLKKVHDIYAFILEKHHEIYRNQIDFHNYCLTRLQYHTYYSFHLIRENYTTQAYFVKAAEGILGTTLEMHNIGLQHKTICERKLEARSDDHNINYCLDLIHIISSQRLYHPGVYAAIYRLSVIVDLPPLFKTQCLMRTYGINNSNALHWSLWPMIFKAILSEDYKLFPEVILCMLPRDSQLSIDQDSKKLVHKDGKEFSIKEYATIYIEEVGRRMLEGGIYDLKYFETLIRCACEIPDGSFKLIEPITDTIYRSSRFTFKELSDHHLYLMKACQEHQGKGIDSVLRSLLENCSKTIEECYQGVPSEYS